MMQKGGPVELNFEILERQKWNEPTDRADRVDQKNDSFFVSSVNDSKKSVKVWAKYLHASRRSSLAFLENVVDYCVLSYH